MKLCPLICALNLLGSEGKKNGNGFSGTKVSVNEALEGVMKSMVQILAGRIVDRTTLKWVSTRNAKRAL